MKKIFFLLLIFFTLSFPIFAQVDDIQPDAVNVNQFVDTQSTESTTITGEHIKSFQSNILINKDGTVGVKETIVYDFADLQKHGIYRDINYITTNKDGKKYKLDFNNFTVSDEKGAGYQFHISDVNEKYTRLKIGDGDRLITGIHNYVISYRVSGALTYFSDHDEFYWNVNGNDWTVSIANTSASVVWPQEIKKEDVKTACYTGSRGSKESLCSTELLSLNDRTKIVTKTNGSFGSGEGLSIAVSFPKNIVAVLEAKEFVPFWETLVGRLVAWLLGLLALIWYVFLPFYIIYRWIRYGRDPSSSSHLRQGFGGQAGQVQGVVTAWFDPPKTVDGKRFLTPGEVGTLGDETVDMKDISATIVDLARRGYLIIDERKKSDYYLVKKKNIDDSLLKYEKSIITEFFGSKKEIRIKDQELSTEVAQIKNEMYEQVVEDKLFDKNPQTTRTKYYVLAGIALFTSNFFLAIVAFLFGRAMPRKTVFGNGAKNISSSLKNFLSSQKRQLEFQADKQMMFERLLPFAVAFGVEKIWAKRFENLNIKQPNWYHSYSNTNFSSYLLVSSLNNSFRSVATASTPTRSSTGHSSGFSGGFSGGGGGGGGGGSW